MCERDKSKSECGEQLTVPIQARSWREGSSRMPGPNTEYKHSPARGGSRTKLSPLLEVSMFRVHFSRTGLCLLLAPTRAFGSDGCWQGLSLGEGQVI